MYLLDTNVLSEIRKIGSGKANTGVVDWSKMIHPDDLFISVITLLEIEQGILKLQRKDTNQAKRYAKWLYDDVIPQFAKHTINIDSKIALKCASLHVPDKRPANDALIASTAIIHGLTLVTRNVADFQRLPVAILNPFND